MYRVVLLISLLLGIVASAVSYAGDTNALFYYGVAAECYSLPDDSSKIDSYFDSIWVDNLHDMKAILKNNDKALKCIELAIKNEYTPVIGEDGLASIKSSDMLKFAEILLLKGMYENSRGYTEGCVEKCFGALKIADDLTKQGSVTDYYALYFIENKVCLVLNRLVQRNALEDKLKRRVRISLQRYFENHFPPELHVEKDMGFLINGLVWGLPEDIQGMDWAGSLSTPQRMRINQKAGDTVIRKINATPERLDKKVKDRLVKWREAYVKAAKNNSDDEWLRVKDIVDEYDYSGNRLRMFKLRCLWRTIKTGFFAKTGQYEKACEVNDEQVLEIVMFGVTKSTAITYKSYRKAVDLHYRNMEQFHRLMDELG